MLLTQAHSVGQMTGVFVTLFIFVAAGVRGTPFLPFSFFLDWSGKEGLECLPSNPE